MVKNPKKIIIKDKEGEIKSIQVYEYNEFGDPTLFKKTDKEGEVVTHWVYEYKYLEDNLKSMMKISDLKTNKETIMEYNY